MPPQCAHGGPPRVAVAFAAAVPAATTRHGLTRRRVCLRRQRASLGGAGVVPTRRAAVVAPVMAAGDEARDAPADAAAKDGVAVVDAVAAAANGVSNGDVASDGATPSDAAAPTAATNGDGDADVVAAGGFLAGISGPKKQLAAVAALVATAVAFTYANGGLPAGVMEHMPIPETLAVDPAVPLAESTVRGSLSDAGASAAGAFKNFIEGPRASVALALGASAFIQALTGFGFAIVSVGVLSQMEWIAHSSIFNDLQPVAAVLGGIVGWSLVLPEIHKVKWRELAPLLIASTVATPIGALLFESIDPSVALRALGAVIFGFVVYSLTGVKVPRALGSKPGAIALGALAGAFGGAFDIAGPPLVVHAQAAEWSPANGDFKRNILTVVSVNSLLVIGWDIVSGRAADFYVSDFVIYSLPMVIVGIVAGKWLGSKLDPAAFKNIVLLVCLTMGVRLLTT
eukprot:TRINITY_DN1878_c0_g1_i5.p2 TRINITY_DN1878_c0_g1~~TRINITY_DN1878_c0_g1_i5.p2  ORF type:complete len:456 (+),score=213.41 TRINITY_DN1878_c0_g1_i5:600-1967(+)